MKKKVLVVRCWLLIAVLTVFSSQLVSPAFAAGKQSKKSVQPIKPMKEFVDELMAKMTLQEKIGQLNLQVAGDIVTGGAVNTDVGQKIAAGQMGGVFNLKGADKIRELQEVAVNHSRLGIPLIVGMDVIHGYETIFPIPLALSCSWDLEAVEQSARIAAREASADGINWTYSPMVDICVDARWGRTAESNGEDPYLGSRIAEAMVRGYQGDYSRVDNIMACVKHFALYGASEAGRDYNTVDMSRVRMFNQYLPPYKAAAQAGAGSFMSSFNIVDGVPATANRWLLNDVLRNQWKYDGFVVTDYGSIGEMLSHGVGEDLQRASAQALQAGTDMDMCTEGFLKTLEQSYNDGLVSMDDIDLACRRVLEAKYKLGLFQNPYRFCDARRHAKDVFTAENREAARSIAAETFVLLKNEKMRNGGNEKLLPLKKEGKIALIGPLADTRSNLCGTWCVAFTPDRYSTLKEGFERALAGKAQLLYAQGSIVCAMGETADMSGESSSRSKLEIPDVQRELLAELVTLGKPVVLLNFSGRATVLTWEQQHVDAIMNVWFGGSEAADAIADVVFGDKVPSGKLTVTMPQSVGQVPIYYNHLNTGRPVPEGADHYFKYQSNYLDVRNDPLYPFGYGLSYTRFEYGEAKIVKQDKQKVYVSVLVKNVGSRDGDEVVQLYASYPESKVEHPKRQLKAFERVTIPAGESRDVVLVVDKADLTYWSPEAHAYIPETGRIHFEIGASSADIRTKADYKL